MPARSSLRKHRSLNFQQLEERRVLDASALRITEFLASNDNNLADFQGDSSDWLEIYNPSNTTASLDGLYLTDDDEELNQWQFPTGVSLDPGEFLVVFASGKDLVAPSGELHTNFKLSAGGEFLGLIAADGFTVIDAYSPEFPQQTEDISYGLEMTDVSQTLVAEGTIAKAHIPTNASLDSTWQGLGFDDSVFSLQGPTGFGYENSSGVPDYADHYNTSVPSGTTSLYVRTEFNVSSLQGIESLTLRMKYDDGFVAYLNGVQIASANAPNSVAWNSTATTFHDDFNAIQFQEFDVSAAISSLVLGDNVLAVHGMNFGPGSSDFLISPELVATQAIIATPESPGYFREPTPGAVNGESFAGFAEEPTFSVPHGFYTTPQQVEIASATAGASIVYTTDGSTPEMDENLNLINGIFYSGPITVSQTTTLRARAFQLDYEPSFVQSSSYLFLDDIVDQSPNGQAPAGWPNSDVNGQHLDYGIDPEIISLYGEQAVKDSLASLPSITLTTDIANLFDPTTGIYVNALNRGAEWEREASVELIDPNGAGGFATNAGLRIRGGYGRNDFNPKHAFRLYFRSEYGDGLLSYPLFGEEGTDKFDVLDLRTASNYAWAVWGGSVNGLQNSYLREVFARDTQADMEHPYTRSRYYHLYLNGQYWGIYMTQERVQEHFGESYFGGDKEDYDVVKADSTEAYTFEVADGNDLAWQQLFLLAQDLANNPTSNADNYWAMQGLNTDGTRDEQLEVLLDVDNLIDYMMIIIYTGGTDTGISAFLGGDRANNWFGIRNRETGDEGFQFFLHDNEHSLGAGELTGTLHGTIEVDRTGPFYTALDDDYNFFNPVYLHQDLLTHPEYVQRFIDRAEALLFNDGVLTVDQNVARMLERKNQVEPAIIAEAARWGDAKRAIPYTKQDWDNEVDWLLNTAFQVRSDIVVGQLQADGLYNSLGAPVFSQLGGEVYPGFPLQISASQGTIYYSLDGQTDPRMIGGSVNPSAAVSAYSGPIVLTSNTTVWARLLEPSGQWSGLIKADFTVPQLAGDFNSSGSIDSADLDLWKSTFGSTTDLRADGNGDQRVDARDYALWREKLAQQPSVVAAATASETTVTGVSTNLNVLGDVGIGEANLIYTWNVTGPGAVSFAANGNHAASSTTATFSQAGEYHFTAIVENPGFGAVATSSVTVTVEQTVSGVAIDPQAATVAAGSTAQINVYEIDQFDATIQAAANPAWSISTGTGTINQAGVFFAPQVEGTTLLQVSAAAGTATASLEIVAPIAWYQADSTNGATLVDSSASGSHGTLVGNASSASGVGSGALLLDGGHVELPAGIVDGVQAITLSTWVNLTSVDTWSRIFDFGSGESVNMFLTPQAGGFGGPLRFALKTNGQGEQQIDGPGLTAGQWYHVAVTIDGNVGALYVNGQLVGSNNNMVFTPADLGFTTQNYLGDSQYPADPPLRGLLDDFRIYDTALSADQIQRMAAPIVVTPASAAANPVMTSSTTLSVLGDDLLADESTLTYHWSVAEGSSGVSFTNNNSNAAKNTAASFPSNGNYLLQAMITNPTTGLSTTSYVQVLVDFNPFTPLAPLASSGFTTHQSSSQLTLPAYEIAFSSTDDLLLLDADDLSGELSGEEVEAFSLADQSDASEQEPTALLDQSFAAWGDEDSV